MFTSIRKMQDELHAKKADGGFTLIELLIVIVVLGVLAGITVFGLAQFKDDSEKSACRADEKIVNTASDAYVAGKGTAPTAVNGAAATTLEGAKYIKAPVAGTWVYDADDKTWDNTACA